MPAEVGVPSEAFEGVSSGKEPWHNPWALHSGKMRGASTEVCVSGEAARQEGGRQEVDSESQSACPAARQARR